MYHRVKWNGESVSRLWGYYATQPSEAHTYFAKAAGAQVVKVARRHVRLEKARIIDFGAGAGYLFDHIERQIEDFGYIAIDHSAESIESINERLKASRNFAGGFLTRQAVASLRNTGDVMFGCEVIEHLEDADLEKFFEMTRHILREKATLVLTTPNSEDLQKLEVCCPECGCIFHRWQHVRSWTKQSLAAFVETQGFRIRICRPTYFGPWHRHLGHLALLLMERTRKLPSLLCIADRV